MHAMEMFARFHRIVDLLCNVASRRIPEAEFATADGWLDDEQWLAGLPDESREPVIWGWWRAQ
jgi:hypothetical protein